MADFHPSFVCPAVHDGDATVHDGDAAFASFFQKLCAYVCTGNICTGTVDLPALVPVLVPVSYVGGIICVALPSLLA